MRFAIVPSRAGSKRIPSKNMRMFLGKPIIQRVLETVRESSLFDRIIVSTDSPSTASFVESLGFEAPFSRPAELADDFASTADVANHAIQWLLGNGASARDTFLLTYPTSVMMTTHHLHNSLQLLAPGKCDFVFAGAAFPSAIERAWMLSKQGEAKPEYPSRQGHRSQDLEPKYFDAGQFYWTTSNGWNSSSPPASKKIYEIDLLEAIDINTEQDWVRAELVYQLLRQTTNPS